MFSKRFLLFAIVLFTLVHFIACLVEPLETDKSLSTTTDKSTGRKKPSQSSSVKVMKNSKYSDGSDDGASNQATFNIGSEFDEPEAISSKHKRVKRSQPKSTDSKNNNGNNNEGINKSNSDLRPTSIRSSKSISEVEKFDIPKDDYNFSETSQSFLESPLQEPTSSRVKKQGKLDSIQSGTDGLKRNSRKSKLNTEIFGKDTPILSNEPINIEGNEYNDAKTPQFVESLPEYEEEDIMDAQDEFIPPFYKHHSSNDDIIMSSLVYSNIFSGLPGKHAFNFDDSSSDEELETLDRSDPITEENNMHELDQSSEEPVILSIFKVVVKSLRDLFSALKDILQRSHT